MKGTRTKYVIMTAVFQAVVISATLAGYRVLQPDWTGESIAIGSVGILLIYCAVHVVYTHVCWNLFKTRDIYVHLSPGDMKNSDVDRVWREIQRRLDEEDKKHDANG